MSKGFICKGLNNLEPISLECICPVRLSSKKWIWYSIYRPLPSQNLEIFFNGLIDSLSKANEKYKNFVVGWFCIDIGLSYGEDGKLEEPCPLCNF